MVELLKLALQMRRRGQTDASVSLYHGLRSKVMAQQSQNTHTNFQPVRLGEAPYFIGNISNNTNKEIWT